MRIYVICPVREITETQRRRVEEYVTKLEAEGHVVHSPLRDTAQNATGWEACLQNGMAMANADRIDICYHSSSTGSHYDLGFSIALRKQLKLAICFTPKTPETRTFLDVIEAVEGISPYQTEHNNEETQDN